MAKFDYYYIGKIDNEYKVVQDDKSLTSSNINITDEENSKYTILFIFPYILTNPEWFREFIQIIFDKYCKKDPKKTKPFIFISSVTWLRPIDKSKGTSEHEIINDFMKDKSFTSFLFNSSIWVHYVERVFYVDENSNLTLDIEATQNNYNEVIQNLNLLRVNRDLLEADTIEANTIEYIEYHLRLESNNYLLDVEGTHGKNITPFLYSEEYQCLESIKKINKEDKKCQLEPTFDKHEIQLYNNAHFNILLVDDKPQKGPLIEQLLNHFKRTDFTKNTVWEEGKVSYCFFKQGFIGGKDVKEDEVHYVKRIEFFAKNCDFENNTNIFHVASVKDTVRLLSADKIGTTPIRFDLIMLDYLLDYKDGSKTEREYSSRLFEWLTNNKKDESDSFGLGQSDEKLITAIKNNRGPLQKLWFFPITAFNQTFIDNLRNDGVRLIDYYWHISRGADPINTPYLFLRTLNSFLYLQLQQAVYDLSTLTRFLDRTTKTLKNVKSEDFQSHMGSEYTTIIQKHGWRSVISHDAKAGSSFSSYIWANFYSENKNKYLFRLMDKMQKFFHVCTFADESDYDKIMLYWKELDIFITDYWTDLTDEYTDKIIDKTGGCILEDRYNKRKEILEKEKIIKPDLKIFQININNFLGKNNN